MADAVKECQADTDPGDDWGNNLVATGALYALLARETRANPGGLKEAWLPGPEASNQIDVRFTFLRSAYRITVERVPE